MADPAAFPSLSPSLRVGGGLGIAGVVAGVGLVLLACGGFDAALALSPVPVALGVAGLSATAVGGRRSADPAVLAAAFANALAVAGGLLGVAAWLHWPVLYEQVR